MTAGDDTILLGFPDYRDAARRLAAAAGLRYEDVAVHRFPDGESLLKLPERLPRHAVFCRTLANPNQKLTELELAAVTARKLGATRLTLVAPYLCYMRQDTAFRPGEAVSQRIIGAWLARLFDALITVDPHLHRSPRLGDAVPDAEALALSATGLMAEWVADLGRRPVVLGPDEESAQWVERVAAAASLDHGVGRKRRLGDREVSVELPELPLAGRDVLLVDDVASTGRSLEAAARLVAARQARSIRVLVTHALFVDDAIARLEAAGVVEILSTDSIPHPTNRLRLDGLLAKALSDLGTA